MRIIRKEEYRKTSWRCGNTTEIFLSPEDGDYARRHFDYRVSSATLETEESVFTPLPGITRVIMPLENTMVLVHGQDEKVMLAPYQAYHFNGETVTKGIGMNRDFNLMMNHGCKGHVEVITIKGMGSLEEETENTLYFYEKGSMPLEASGAVIRPGDSILVRECERLTMVNSAPEQVILLKAVMPDL
jgi:environmental stress-induced protein Ves